MAVAISAASMMVARLGSSVMRHFWRQSSDGVDLDHVRRPATTRWLAAGALRRRRSDLASFSLGWRRSTMGRQRFWARYLFHDGLERFRFLFHCVLFSRGAIPLIGLHVGIIFPVAKLIGSCIQIGRGARFDDDNPIALSQ